MPAPEWWTITDNMGLFVGPLITPIVSSTELWPHKHDNCNALLNVSPRCCHLYRPHHYVQESLAPAYMSGQVFQPGMIDRFVSHAFYTRGSDSIVSRWVG